MEANVAFAHVEEGGSSVVSLVQNAARAALQCE